MIPFTHLSFASILVVGLHRSFLSPGPSNLILSIDHTRWEPLQKLGLDPHKAVKLALKLHAHSVQHAYKLVSTRRALEKSTDNSQQSRRWLC